MSERGHRFGSRGFWLAIAVMLAVPVFFTATFLADQGSHPSLKQIEARASVKFPESARLINSYNRSFLEIHVLAKVEMDRADVPEFIKSLPQPPKALDKYDAQRMFHYDFDWWDPGSAERFRAVEAIEDERKGRIKVWRVSVSLDDPRKAVVYLDYASFAG